MSKPKRIQFPGATYHVMSRGNRKGRIFEDDRDRRQFLWILADALERFTVECPSHCLMGNHYHFIAHTPLGNIALFMKVVNGGYVQYINRRHKWTGHLFDGPYKALVIGDSCYLRTAMAYVARNPVEAGFVERPELWKWSSYAGTIGAGEPESFTSNDWLQRAFPSASLEEARARLADLVLNFPGELILDPRDVVFGNGELQAEVRELIGRTMYLSDVPRAYRAMARPDLSQLLACVTRSARVAAIRRAHVVHGYLLSEIARCLQVHPTTISRLLAQSRTQRKKADGG
ncbi:MAG TPA: transposase [Vicinamibacterales bacterium]|nr:transposase [Vicinamibacterales bacterium]